jgi:hypothetical protein
MAMVREERSREPEGFTNNLKATGEDLGVDVFIRSLSEKANAGHAGTEFGMGCYVRLGGL